MDFTVGDDIRAFGGSGGPENGLKADRDEQEGLDDNKLELKTVEND